MIAQLVINYGDAVYNIPCAYIAYVVGSFVIPAGMIKIGKVTHRRLQLNKAIKAEKREHERLEAEQAAAAAHQKMVQERRQRVEYERQRQAEYARRKEEQRLLDEQKAAEKERQIKASLPGIWWKTYQALQKLDCKQQRAQTLEALIRGARDGRAQIDVDRDPLPPEGMKHLTELIASYETNICGYRLGQSEESERRLASINFYLPVYVASWVKREQRNS